MLKQFDDNTQKAINTLIAYYCEQALATVEKIASSYDEPTDSDMELVKAQLGFSQRLRFWEKLENVETTLCVDTRYLDDAGLPKEFSFKTEYANGHVTYGGLINHGNAEKPRWSTHT